MYLPQKSDHGKREKGPGDSVFSSPYTEHSGVSHKKSHFQLKSIMHKSSSFSTSMPFYMKDDRFDEDIKDRPLAPMRRNRGDDPTEESSASSILYNQSPLKNREGLFASPTRDKTSDDSARGSPCASEKDCKEKALAGVSSGDDSDGSLVRAEQWNECDTCNEGKKGGRKTTVNEGREKDITVNSDDDDEGKRKAMGRNTVKPEEARIASPGRHFRPGPGALEASKEVIARNEALRAREREEKKRLEKAPNNLTRSIVEEKHNFEWQKPAWSSELKALRPTKNGSKLRVGEDVQRPISKGVDRSEQDV